MARSSLRITRRPKGRPARNTPQPKSLVAASRPVLDPAAEFKSSMGGRSSGDDWQSTAWEMYRRVGELRYYVGWRSGSCSRVSIVASEVDPLTGKPTGSIGEETGDAVRVREIVNSIAAGALGQKQLIKRAVEQLSVGGECWIALLDQGEVDFENNPLMTWLVVSGNEVKTSSNGMVEIKLPTGETHEYNESSDSMIRVWLPDPEEAWIADSPVQAAMDSLHEIVRTTKTIANASKSRLIGNGIVFLPQEMSLPATQGGMTALNPGDDEDDEVLAFSGIPAVKQLQELIWQVATTAYDDEDSMAALIPMFATVPAEHIKAIQHLKFDNQVTQISIQTRNDAISRLAMALDVAPERLLGLGSSTNHWTAWQISDEDVQLHISPIMETLCQALTTNVLHKLLIEEGIDPRPWVVWYDASGLTTDPDKTNAAIAAFTGGAITAEAFRDYLGLDSNSGYDFDTIEGWEHWARDLCGRQPQFAPIFSKMLGPGGQKLPLVLEVAGAPGTPTPGEQKQPQQQKALPKPAAKKPATEASSKASSKAGTSQQASALPAEVELTMVERLLMHRALEMAGKRMRTRSDYARLRTIPMHQTHWYMSPVDPNDVPRLIDGWDSALADAAIALMPIDTEEMRARVYAAIKQELTKPLIDEFGTAE